MSTSSTASQSTRSKHLHYDFPCECGYPSRIQTSRIPSNPDKRFLVCNQPVAGKKKCNFWEWMVGAVDPVEDKLAVEIEGLKGEVNNGKEEISRLNNEMEEVKLKLQEIRVGNLKFRTIVVVFIVLYLFFRK